MKIMQKIWDDIIRGENIDVYLTVIVAIIVAILTLLNITPQTLMQPLTLAILGLLALSNIGNRYRIEQILQDGSRSLSTVFLDEFPDDILNTDFANFEELWLVGISLRYTTHKRFHEIRRRIQNGCVAHILLVHPDDNSIAVAESREYRNPNIERMRQEILGTLSDYSALVSLSGIKIRTIEYPIDHSIIAINPNSASGRFYIAYHSFGVSGGSRPKIVVEPKDDKWYEFFREELNNLWNHGVDWTAK